MGKRIALSARARADLVRLRKFIAADSPASARLAIERLLNGIGLLRDFPELGVRVRSPFRHLILPHGKSGYIVRYRLTESEVVVVRIWHGKEDRPR